MAIDIKSAFLHNDVDTAGAGGRTELGRFSNWRNLTTQHRYKDTGVVIPNVEDVYDNELITLMLWTRYTRSGGQPRRIDVKVFSWQFRLEDLRTRDRSSEAAIQLYSGTTLAVELQRTSNGLNIAMNIRDAILNIMSPKWNRPASERDYAVDGRFWVEG